MEDRTYIKVPDTTEELMQMLINSPDAMMESIAKKNQSDDPVFEFLEKYSLQMQLYHRPNISTGPLDTIVAITVMLIIITIMDVVACISNSFVSSVITIFLFFGLVGSILGIISILYLTKAHKNVKTQLILAHKNVIDGDYNVVEATVKRIRKLSSGNVKLELAHVMNGQVVKSSVQVDYIYFNYILTRKPKLGEQVYVANFEDSYLHCFLLK